MNKRPPVPVCPGRPSRPDLERVGRHLPLVARHAPQLRVLLALLALGVAKRAPRVVGLLGLAAILAAADRVQAANLEDTAGNPYRDDVGNPYPTKRGDLPSHRYFDTASEPPSVANLSRALTINGTTVQPSVFVNCYNASASFVAEAGGTFAEAGTGASPTYNQGSPLMGSDGSVKINGNKYLKSGTTIASTTHDRVVGVIFKNPASHTGALFATKNAGVTASGMNIYVSGNGIFASACDGTTFVQCYNTTAITYNAWYMVEAYYDSSGNIQLYVNGLASGSPISMAALGNVANGATSIGANVDASSPTTCTIAAAWYYQSPSGWLDAQTTAAVRAAERFRALTGLRPQASAAGVDTVPITRARNCVATLEKYNTTTSAVEYYTVGENWLPVGSRWDAVLGKVVINYRPSAGGTNKFLQSEDMATTWAKLDAGDTIAATTFIADSTDGDHGVSQAVTLTAASWVVMVEATKGNKNWLYISDDTVANCTGYFDLNTPAAGTFGAGATGGISSKGDRVLCWMTFTGTAAAHTFKIQTADANGDKSIVGDGTTVNTTIHRTQLQLGTYPTSYIATTTAAATRVKDELEYAVTGPGEQGAIVFDLNVRTCDVATACTLVDVSDGGATNRAFVNLIAAGDVLTANIGADGLVTGTTDVADGVTRRVCMTWKPGRIELWISGVQEGAADVSYTASAAMNQVAIGMAYNNAAQPSTPTGVRGVKLFNRFVNGAQLSGGLS